MEQTEMYEIITMEENVNMLKIVSSNYKNLLIVLKENCEYNLINICIKQ